jgi:DNA-binding transcriptional LysR family regulator
MQLESLKIFCDVVRWASFSRGAAENGISQSSASQAVLQLENRLGVKLIDRSKRPLVLTPEGKLYYDGCKELVGRYEELENRVRELGGRSSVTGTVGVASIYSVGLHHMSQYVKTFEQRYPEASVRLEYLHPAQVVEHVMNEEADLGLISYPRKWPDLVAIPWRDEEMVLAVPPGHRLACRASVDVRELQGERLVSYDGDLAIRRAVDRFLRHHGVDLEIVLEFDNIENIKRAVEIEAGIAIVPEPCLVRELSVGSLAVVRLEGQAIHPRFHRPLAILHRRHDKPEGAAARFLELLVGAADSSRLASAGGPRREPAASHSRL